MLQALQDSAYAEWVRSSWGWAIALTIHAFGVATVAGLVFIMGLRLFGFFRTVPPTSLGKFFPFIWVGIALQFVSGFTLWCTKPMDYLKDLVFDIKFTSVVVGVVITFYFQKFLKREAAGFQESGVITKRGVYWGVAASLIWAIVIITGRLTAYLGTLYSGSGG